VAEKQSILVVGAGSIGERHLRCFLATNRVHASFCEVNPVLRQTIAERYPAAKAFADFDSALKDAKQAAVICTPAPLHIPLALTAARRGVHLLIEKPLSTSLDEVETLKNEAARQKLTVAVAYVYRAHPALGAMREAILSGRFGRPVQIVGVFGQHFPFYRPAYRETYYRDHATGGGAVQDALTHVINAAEWLVGPVERLVADAAHQVLDGVQVEDTVHVITRHGSVLGSYSLNQHQAPNEGQLTIICEQGTVRFEMHQHRWMWQTEPAGTWQVESAAKLERDTLFIRQAEHFLDALEGLRPLACSLDEGVQTLRVNLKILGSIDEHRWQTV
jgi:predicted dehydrogenase